MDNGILKKRLNTFKTSKGTLRKISDEVIMEVLRAWESWPGSSKEFYQSIGVTVKQLAILIKKGKRLVREGIAGENEFSEIKIEVPRSGEAMASNGKIVLNWEKGNVIHFEQVEQLVDFLKKVA